MDGLTLVLTEGWKVIVRKHLALEPLTHMGLTTGAPA